MTMRPPGTSTSGTSALTNGNSTSRLRRTDHEQVLGGVVLDAAELADGLAVGGLDPQPDELVVVELLGILRPLGRVDAALSSVPRAASAALRSASSAKRDQRAARMGARAADGRGCLRRRSAARAPSREASLGLVGAQLHDHLAAQPVRRPIRPTTT